MHEGPGNNQADRSGRMYRIKAKGGHRQYKHPVKRGRVTVPGQMNAELDKKTEKSVLGQAGLE